MDWAWLEQMGTFVAGGGLVGLLGFIKWYLRRMDLKKKDRIPVVLGRIHDVYHILNTVLSESCSKRVLLLRAENGGDVPALGKDIYSSIIYESFDHPLESIKDRWLQQKLDEHYLRMLMHVAQQGEYQVTTDHMRPGVLKDLYESTGVKFARVFKVHSRPGAFFYLSCHLTEVEDMTARERDLLRVAVSQLAALFEEDLNELT